MNSQIRADPVVDEIFQIYGEVIEETETKINALYNKYQTENSLNASQARKYIKGEEYTVWRKSMEKYLGDISDTGKDSDVAFELNTLAMKSRISREEKLLSQIYREMYDIANVQQNLMNECLEDVLQSTYDRTSKSIIGNISSKFQVYRLDKELVEAILEYPWHRKTFSTSIWDNVDELCFKAKRIIAKGFTAGYSVQKMTGELKKNFDVGKYEADRLIRTECRFFANQGELQGYKANGITKYIFKTGKSENICKRCNTYNNVAIPIEKAEVYVNFPPLHPYCKCYMTPYFEDSLFDNNKDVENLESVDVEDKLIQEKNKKEKDIINRLEEGLNSAIIKVSKTVKISEPNSINIIFTKKGGYDVNFYDNVGLLSKQYTSHDHGNRKNHPYGKNGEHIHEIEWVNGKRVSITRELTKKEREELFLND